MIKTSNENILMKAAMSSADLPAPRIRQTGFYTIAFKRLRRRGRKGGRK